MKNRVRVTLLLLMIIVIGPVLKGDSLIRDNHQDDMCLKEIQNPFLMQIILQESKSIVDHSILDKLKRRAV